MQQATESYVLGDFDNIAVEYHGVKSRFYKKNGRYYVETQGNKEKTEVFEIKYTFGFYPLQQYLIELPDGFIQALNIAWDSRPKKEGGQHWYHLRSDEDITREHPFYWTRYFQNWNGRCADCHSTSVNKNYDSENHRFNTTWSEINVGCEACHGPGSQHVAIINDAKYTEANTGFTYTKQKPLFWQFTKSSAIAQPKGKKNEQHIDMCGTCHALRNQLDENFIGHKFHDTNLIRLPLPPNYFPDGQILEEVFVMGSFLQSKMHEKGVTCMNCHDPHTNKVLVEGNGLCGQCHDAQIFDSPQHHFHDTGSAGAQCVNCHMPERVYMGVDNRRDHSFTVPRPQLSKDLGVPNACTQCHSEKSDDWAIDVLKKVGLETDIEHWAYVNQEAAQTDATVSSALLETIASGELPLVINAALLSHFSVLPSKISVQLSLEKLQDESPVIRRAAVTAMENVPPALRWQILSHYMDDTSKSVRFEIARVLAGVLNQLPPQDQQNLAALLKEYREGLEISADSPATQLVIANLELAMGNDYYAELAYEKALRSEPNYVPAMINFADFYRRAGRDEKAAQLLKNALKVAPESGGAQHSYGLYLVRQKKYKQALPHLEAALGADDSLPRYAYVYAVALDNQNNTEDAINVLLGANKRWPRQYDLLMTLVFFLEKSEKFFSIPKYVKELEMIAPKSPDVVRLVKKYRG